MITDESLLTPTLARVYAEQGHLRKAARIYEHLLKASPHELAHADALEEIEKRLAADRSAGDPALVGLLSEWIDLEIGYARLKQLDTLKKMSVRRDSTKNPINPKTRRAQT